MASPLHRCISRRRNKSSSLPDLRQTIVHKIAGRFRREYVCVIGDGGTGRNTLVRRFLNMSDGPFRYSQVTRYNYRFIMVHLSERPNIRDQEIVNLCVYIFNLEGLSSHTFHLSVHLNSFAIVFDISRRSTFFSAVHCMHRYAAYLGHNRYILVGNKVDHLRPEVSQEEAVAAAAERGARRYYGCSALMNINMDSVFDALLLMALDPFRPLPP
ncbi:ras-related protein Rab-18-like [Argiope bruennichi]|uniref:Uncharacterized protein n=1 Tax=Argiope bruennichi TaxID=94029 RepID=A0A8T0E3X3_ARGBR|nr:ras-related protein Rab-18-like [Argiope bruennichi]KAF8765133.1 hypothetical protein HNY73_023126 [Argiope bruennichi]